MRMGRRILRAPCGLTFVIVPLLLLSATVAKAGWVMVCDDGTTTSQDVPADLSKKLKDLSDRHARVKSIAFTQANGWVILFDRNGHAESAANLPDGVAAKLKELSNENAEINAIALTPWHPSGWLIVHDGAKIESQHFPDPFREQLDRLVENHSKIRSIALVESGSIAAIYDRNGYLVEDAEAKRKLKALAHQEMEIRAIAFTPWNGWAILYDGGFMRSKDRDLPDGCENALKELFEKHKSPVSIAFCWDPIALSKDDEPTRAKVMALLSRYHVPGVSIALIDKGQIAWAHAYGQIMPGGKPVTAETRFQAGSLSKPVAAAGVLRLVDRGKIDLDEDLDQYLKSWKIPPSKTIGNQRVTLRRVLSHTAGFTVHGFPGYRRDQKLPSLVEILSGARPAANTSAIIVRNPPGQQFQYSGGGYLVMQQAVIDVTARPFDHFMNDEVLKPLGMTNSSYAQPPPNGFENVAALGHDQNGKPIAGGWNVYPELAAAGLWTTPSDYARFVIGIQDAVNHKPGAILKPETASAMLTRQPPADCHWGLGVSVAGKGDDQSFTHGGRNAGFDSLMIGFPRRGQGAVIMLNANETGGLAEELAQDLRTEYRWPE